jgi:hypothetical protein
MHHQHNNTQRINSKKDRQTEQTKCQYSSVYIEPIALGGDVQRGATTRVAQATEVGDLVRQLLAHRLLERWQAGRFHQVSEQPVIDSLFVFSRNIGLRCSITQACRRRHSNRKPISNRNHLISKNNTKLKSKAIDPISAYCYRRFYKNVRSFAFGYEIGIVTFCNRTVSDTALATYDDDAAEPRPDEPDDGDDEIEWCCCCCCCGGRGCWPALLAAMSFGDESDGGGVGRLLSARGDSGASGGTLDRSTNRTRP